MQKNYETQQGYAGTLTDRQLLEIMRGELENERSSFKSHWRDLSEFILPRRSRFFISDSNRGDRRNQKILDTSPTQSARTLRSGMMSGITSPARPWFRLTMPDPDMAEFGPVKEWLGNVTRRMNTVFTRSNLYQILSPVYGDTGTFGTGCMFMEEDFDNVAQFYSFPIGSYYLANDEKLRVRVFMREFRMTVRQIVMKFGSLKSTGHIDFSNMSTQVMNHWNRGNYEAWIDVFHAVWPNNDHDPRKAGPEFKKFRSDYWEQGMNTNPNTEVLEALRQDKFLRRSGYDRFPVLAPRWEITGEDVYGTDCPGMTALGDVRQLMKGESRALQAIDKMVNPPMVAPAMARGTKTSILPGDITYMDEMQKGTFRPAHEVNFRLDALENKQQQVRQRISRAFYEDLFLMLAQSDRRQITAREIEERHEEKLLALGPVLEQLNQDLLDPLIDNTFDIMNEQGLIPPPPEDIAGSPLKVEYISIMAQAQKLVGIAGDERLMGMVGQSMQLFPEVKDKFDVDKFLEGYADRIGVEPGIIRSREQVEEIRAAEAQAMQQQAQLEQMQGAASAAKDLSQTEINDQNALGQLLDQAQAGQVVPQ